MRKNGKKLLPLVLVLVMVLAMLTGAAFAAEPTSGTCGDNVMWTLQNGVLTISGTGKMRNYFGGNEYDSRYIPWYNQRDTIKSVVTKSGVTCIGEWAFCDCTSLTSITIPDSVTIIGDSAFNHCSSLASLEVSPANYKYLSEDNVLFDKAKS